MEGISGEATNVLDIKNNIYHGESLVSIKIKVIKDFKNPLKINPNSCLSLVLKIILFGEKENLTYGDHKTKVRITSYDELINELIKSSNDTKQLIY